MLDILSEETRHRFGESTLSLIDEEIKCLQALLSEEAVTITPPFSVLVALHVLKVKCTIRYELSAEYPAATPRIDIYFPAIYKVCGTWRKKFIHDIYDQVIESLRFSPVLVYATQLITTELQQHSFQTRNTLFMDGFRDQASLKLNKEENGFPENIIHSKTNNTLEDTVVPFFSGEVVRDRRSAFQAHLAEARSEREVILVLERIRGSKLVKGATHPAIYAYRFMENDDLFESRDDDGEAGASSKLLFLLQALRLKNIILIVTRWFGGIKLGSCRYKHIVNVAKNLLKTYLQRNECKIESLVIRT